MTVTFSVSQRVLLSFMGVLIAMIYLLAILVGWQASVIQHQKQQILEQAQLTQQKNELASKLSQQYRVAPETADNIVHLTYRYAAEHGVDPRVVLAIMAAESNFDPRAFGPHAEIGLMQVRGFWRNEPGFEFIREWRDLYRPEINIRAGVMILAHYQRETTNWLTAFNRGLAAVRRDESRRRDPDNGYAAKVRKHYRVLVEVTA